MNELCGLSFVVPAYNEAKSIVNTLERLKAVLKTVNLQFEIIVVDDGSTDGMADLVTDNTDVILVRHPVNIGYGNAIKAGIRIARYEWIGIVDADGSYPIEKVPALLEEMKKGYHMVVATRANIDKIDSFTKRISRRLFKYAVRMLNDSRIEDPNSGFRIFKKELVIKLMPFLCGTFSFTTSLTILVSGLSCFVKYLPVHYSQRTGKSKVNHFRDTLRTCQFIVQGIIFFNPIKFFMFLSACLVVFVYIPGMIMAVFNMHTLSLYYILFGTVVAIMIGIAGLADVIRIAMTVMDPKIRTNS